MKIRVQGGTNAGRKPPMKERSAEWRCRCSSVEVVKPDGAPVLGSRLRPGFLVACPDCKMSRP